MPWAVAENTKAAISADMAARVSKMISTSARFWLGMQNSFDLAQLDMSNYEDFKPISLCQWSMLK